MAVDTDGMLVNVQNFLKSLSILKKFLFINLIVFLVIGSLTFIYIGNVKPNLIKEKKPNIFK